MEIRRLKLAAVNFPLQNLIGTGPRGVGGGQGEAANALPGAQGSPSRRSPPRGTPPSRTPPAPQRVRGARVPAAGVYVPCRRMRVPQPLSVPCPAPARCPPGAGGYRPPRGPAARRRHGMRAGRAGAVGRWVVARWVRATGELRRDL